MGRNKVVLKDSDGELGIVKQGDILQHEDGTFYIASLVDCEKYALISLAEGNRWNDPEESIKEVIGTDTDKFKKVSKTIEIHPN